MQTSWIAHNVPCLVWCSLVIMIHLFFPASLTKTTIPYVSAEYEILTVEILAWMISLKFNLRMWHIIRMLWVFPVITVLQPNQKFNLRWMQHDGTISGIEYGLDGMCMGIGMQLIFSANNLLILKHQIFDDASGQLCHMYASIHVFWQRSLQTAKSYRICLWLWLEAHYEPNLHFPNFNFLGEAQ